MPGFTQPPLSADGFAIRHSEPTPTARGGLRMAVLMAGSCLPILGTVLLAPELPELQDKFGAEPGAAVLVPLIVAVPALAIALAAPLAGIAIDRVGRRTLPVVATVLYAVFGTAPLWLESLRAIVASRALLGVAAAVIITYCTTLIGDYYTGQDRHRYLALQTVSASVSATTFLILGGALGDSGWRSPFQLYAVGLLVAPAMVFLLPALRPGTAAAEEAAAGQRTSSTGGLSAICLLTVFVGLVFNAVPSQTAYLVNDLGVQSTGLIGLVSAIASAASVTGCAIFASMIGRPERRLPMIFLLCGAGSLAIDLAHDFGFLLLGTFLNSLGTGLLLPTMLTWAMSGLDRRNRGGGSGLWAGSFFLGQFLCPIVMNSLESRTGSLHTAFGAVGLASGAAAILLLPLLRRPRDDEGAWQA
ncbi:MFS transporter [Streptomyces sp. NRRL B-3229]|uniref:MFS transporter n=1 Tax=Streptomyces sp. NRRL B-3229 TaxID=1463836 RepID=UPI000AD8FC71|nr:MFS transporter [Streptomyces sp. NRRL B-3229]